MTAYDMLDQVMVSVTIWETPEDEAGPMRCVESRSGTTVGRGLASPTDWATEALETALHSL